MPDVNEQLELLSLSNDAFADGLARMIKLFTNSKTGSKDEVTLFAPPSSSDSGNYILLENNMPLSGE